MNKRSAYIKAGIRLHYFPTEKFTTNTYTAYFLAPLGEKSAPLATLLSKVLKKGSAAYPSQEQIVKRAEELYSSHVVSGITKIAESQAFFVSLSALDNRFAFDGTDIAKESVSFFASLLLEPLLRDGVFLEETVEREKKALLDRILSKINNKGAYAMQRCREIMFENEAYRFSIDGSREVVESVTPAELYSAYRDWLDNAPIEIFYIGKESFSSVFARTEHLFKGFAPRKAFSFHTEIRPSVNGVKRVTESADAVQGKLVMGFRAPTIASDKDFFALYLLDAVYGSSPVSKLFMNVREKLSLCYYCSTMCDLDKSVLFVSSGVENENTAAAEKEILQQLSEIAEGNITDKELLCAKASLSDYLRSIDDSPYSVERFMLTQALRESSYFPNDYIERLDQVTKEDLMRVAGTLSLDTVYFLEGTAKGVSADE
jgi:predicted Zn-dependent peptidase